jgi:hypothetical protein
MEEAQSPAKGNDSDDASQPRDRSSVSHSADKDKEARRIARFPYSGDIVFNIQRQQRNEALKAKMEQIVCQSSARWETVLLCCFIVCRRWLLR